MRHRNFYQRPEWKELRNQVILEDGTACCFCGRYDDPQVDHVLPIATYPELALTRTNLRVLCGPCNQRKSAHCAPLETVAEAPDWAKRFGEATPSQPVLQAERIKDRLRATVRASKGQNSLALKTLNELNMALWNARSPEEALNIARRTLPS